MVSLNTTHYFQLIVLQVYFYIIICDRFGTFSRDMYIRKSICLLHILKSEFKLPYYTKEINLNTFYSRKSTEPERNIVPGVSINQKEMA